jgi:hypothetical protein
MPNSIGASLIVFHQAARLLPTTVVALGVADGMGGRATQLAMLTTLLA